MVDLRINKLQEELSSSEAVLITSDANRFVFTGFNSSAGMLLITKNKSYFIIDFRYFEKAKIIVKTSDVLLMKKPFEMIKNLLQLNNVKKIYIETNTVSVDTFKNYQSKLNDFEISDSAEITQKIIRMRSIKTSDEISLIKKAQYLTDETFSYILKRIRPGMTEKEIALDMEFFIRKNGSEGVSFDFIVVSGKNSSMPHGVPTDKKVEVGDFITMDFGAVVGGFHSDMTRTIAVNSVSEEQIKVYNIVLEAQKTAIKAIKPNAICKDIDKIARDIISSYGYGDCFGHGFGHSVGTEIHEFPFCNTTCDEAMKKGVIMTTEPGIYIENKFGVRIEDMVVVTDDGCEDLTNSRKDLIIV